ncbi:hypothetical protein TM239_44880 [Bradyrhizobium sp. TM239]|nr:hypothetical protein TM239_44880 [Bradyrhizobium sp. TM239]
MWFGSRGLLATASPHSPLSSPANAGTHNHRKKFGEDEVFDLRHPAAGRSRGRGVTTGEGTLRRFYPYLICPLGSSYGKAYSYALREGND